MGSSDQSIDVGRKTLGIRLRWTAIATVALSAMASAAVWAARERSAMLEQITATEKRLSSSEVAIRGSEVEIRGLKSETNWMREDIRDLMRWQGVSPRTPAPSAATKP